MSKSHQIVNLPMAYTLGCRHSLGPIYVSNIRRPTLMLLLLALCHFLSFCKWAELINTTLLN